MVFCVLGVIVDYAHILYSFLFVSINLFKSRVLVNSFTITCACVVSVSILSGTPRPKGKTGGFPRIATLPGIYQGTTFGSFLNSVIR